MFPWDNPAAYLPALPQGLVNSAAGFGDGVSFGITSKLRDVLSISSVDMTCGGYGASEVVGNLWIAGTGSGLLISGTKTYVAAATAISFEGAMASGANAYFGPGIISAAYSGFGKYSGGIPLWKLADCSRCRGCG